MIRRFEDGKNWVELENGLYRSSFFPNEDWQEAYVKPENFMWGAWKEVAAGYDPNDLQMSKPCCAGGLGNGPAFYGNGKWHSADCDTLKPKENTNDIFGSAIDYRPKSGGHRCECGGWATANPNAHAHYCPEYKK